MTCEAQIRDAEPRDDSWRAALLADRWAGSLIVSRGVAHDAMNLPALVAELRGVHVGLLTYCLQVDACEVVTLDSLRPQNGVGTALLQTLLARVPATNSSRVRLVTTNDNAAAVRLYKRRGFAVVAVHRDAVATSCQIKPSIPFVGIDGVPIRNEIELEFVLR